MKKISVVFGALLAMVAASAENKVPMKQVRIFSQYTYPFEIARTYWTTDMDLSYALASTLVQWDDQKQIVGGLAKSWEKRGDLVYVFTLRPGLKWSNGESMTAEQVKRSFDRAFKGFPEDLRSLIQMVKAIRAPTPATLEIEATSKAAAENLLGKLTEPQFGVVYVDEKSKVDYGKSSGPFFAQKIAEKETILSKNRNWFAPHVDLADEIVIRMPPPGFAPARALLDESWPNLVQTYSLMSEEVLKAYRERGATIWNRPVDKVYVVTASKRLAKEKKTALLQYLDRKLDRAKVNAGLSGIQIASQIFPYGYELHDPTYKAPADSIELPAEFKKRPIAVLCPGGSRTMRHFENIRGAFASALGIEPDMQIVSLNEANARLEKGDYDVRIGIFGIADPHVEGVMSYYFEGESSVVPAGVEDFVARLDRARAEKNYGRKLEILRGVLRDAKDKGYVVPLFHLSSVGLARDGIDLSQIPPTDESLTYSKIRFKAK